MAMSPQQWWFLQQQLAAIGPQVFPSEVGAPAGKYIDPTGKIQSVDKIPSRGLPATPLGQETGSLPPPASLQEEPTTAPSAPPGQELGTTISPTFDIPPFTGPGATPTDLPSPGAPEGGFPIDVQLPTYTGAPWDEPAPVSSPDTGFPPATPTDLPSGGNVPTNEAMTPTDPSQYLADAPTNVPTSEAMTPTGGPSNVPTNEAMLPTDPNQYASTTGGNVPTNEAMTPTGPAQYSPSDISYYPDPQGNGYVGVDPSGNITSRIPATTVTPETGMPADFNVGIPDPSLGTPPTGNPFVGGAFWTPPGGSIGGPLGVGSAGTVNMGYDYYGQAGLKALLKGGDTSLGFAGLPNANATSGAPTLPVSQWGGAGFPGDVGSAGTGSVHPDFPPRSAR